jgi:hypothetical protein
MEKISRIDLFDSAFKFLYTLRNQLLSQASRYKLRSFISDFNNRIDIQPIPNWRVKAPPQNVDFDRKLYLTCAFTFLDMAEGEIILDLAIRLRSSTLGVIGYYQKGRERINLISDTTFASEGRESALANQILGHLKTAWDNKE